MDTLKSYLMHAPGRHSDMVSISRVGTPAGAVREVDSPCFGCCNAGQCAAEELACEAFKVTAMRNAGDCPPHVWEGKDRTPSSKIFKRIWNYFPGQL